MRKTTQSRAMPEKARAGMGAAKLESGDRKPAENKQSEYFTEPVDVNRKPVYNFCKRFFDIVLSAASLIVLAVPFLIIAIIQKCSAPNEPVFFKQIRIGQGGKPFVLTKFRSMKSSAPRNCSTKDFENHEEYITRWGRFLRDTSIDELPQLVQVFTGKMSLVGPRPLILQEESVHKMREAAGIYAIRPGLTGLAQVNGRDYVTDEEKVQYDRIYLENMGFKMDLKILWMTVKKVVSKADINEGSIPERKE